MLVYNLHDTEELYERFPAGEGQAYFVGGFNASYLRKGDVVLIPIRVGAGLRLGVNAGYMKFSQEAALAAVLRPAEQSRHLAAHCACGPLCAWRHERARHARAISHQQPADALLALIKLHDADPRADKIDLGVGVYRTGQGDTPVFGAIKAAERRLVETQDSKAYLGPEGDMGFVEALMPYVFGGDDPTLRRADRRDADPGRHRRACGWRWRWPSAAGVKRVLMGTPSWPNHAQILADLGLELEGLQPRHCRRHGRHGGAARRRSPRRGEGDAVLLHGCCHNPTGIDYTPAQWDEIAGAAGRQRGCCRSSTSPTRASAHGMEEDAYGVRRGARRGARGAGRL